MKMRVPHKFHVAVLLAVYCSNEVQGAFLRYPWKSASGEMRQPLIEKKPEEGTITVTEILESQDLSFTPEEKQNVMKELAMMAQLENSGVKIDSKLLEARQSKVNKQESMQEDWKSLRDKIMIYLESPDYPLWLKGQLEYPIDNDLFTKVVKLNDLQRNIAKEGKNHMNQGEIT
ncbi:hypothetical protein PGT21_010744 [Puccinia graminis f. sp. tritici]|uniref:Uncharacterized protein n=1 Tax=Puccinia graminis f. sp. tritici TaxID=56615 RepID=A0A5B0NN71_PUCGR|nr:hypothetical protein PGT21_010744 [Puccinia graminis f. sp. tritici]KAA1090006.1 hypothetical protein PGTUg99_033546 [Puccinia graminis f. sp. tritici]